MKDYSTEWAQTYHESYVAQLSKRTYLGGFALWNFFDFGSETRGESVPHINKKGIYKFNREPKDITFFYQAKFSGSPVLHIAAREWSKRGETVGISNPANGGKDEATQPIKIYTNLPEIELSLNGKSLGKKSVDDSKTVAWNVILKNGSNLVEARGQKGEQFFSDKTEIESLVRRKKLGDAQIFIEDLAIDAGSETEYIDDAGTVWEADREYQPGEWGYIGTEKTQLYRTDRNIFDSTDDPLYQTYLQGLSGYRFDIPDGEYEIELRFAETSVFKRDGRVFNVAANGVNLLENFDLNKEAGLLKAVVKTFKIKIESGNGLSLDFQAVKGNTILNGIRLHWLK